MDFRYYLFGILLITSVLFGAVQPIGNVELAVGQKGSCAVTLIKGPVANSTLNKSASTFILTPEKLKIWIDGTSGDVFGSNMGATVEDDNLVLNAHVNPGVNIQARANLEGEIKIKKKYFLMGAPHQEVISKNIGTITGLHFVAEGTPHQRWGIVLSLKSQDGKVAESAIRYEAQFEAPEKPSYVFLPLSRFEPVDRVGRSLGELFKSSRIFEVQTLSFVPIGENKTGPIDAKLRLHNGEVNFGSSLSLGVEGAQKALRDLAAVYGEIELDQDHYLPTWYNMHYRYSKDLQERIKEIGIDYRAALPLVSRLLDRMQANAAHFEEGEHFRTLGSYTEKTVYLNSLLNIYGFVVGEPLDGSVDIDVIWAQTRERLIPVEKGFFGFLHGRYSHALQFIAMLKGASPEEISALKTILTPRMGFELIWTILFDQRAGGVCDPAWWRKFES